jgi:hypothetical protein
LNTVKKVVINEGIGFSLSDKAISKYRELGGAHTPQSDGYRGISREDPVLIRVIEELGTDAAPTGNQFLVRELSPDAEYTIAHHGSHEWICLYAKPIDQNAS